MKTLADVVKRKGEGWLEATLLRLQANLSYSSSTAAILTAVCNDWELEKALNETHTNFTHKTEIYRELTNLIRLGGLTEAAATSA